MKHTVPHALRALGLQRDDAAVAPAAQLEPAEPADAGRAAAAQDVHALALEAGLAAAGVVHDAEAAAGEAQGDAFVTAAELGHARTVGAFGEIGDHLLGWVVFVSCPGTLQGVFELRVDLGLNLVGRVCLF